jgi:putative membrane protein
VRHAHTLEGMEDPPSSPPREESIATQLSSRRTGMSFQRTRMSADRTLMSVIRTSLSLISFGFTLYQLFEKLEAGKMLGAGGIAEMRWFSGLLVLLGIAMLLMGIGFHLAFMRGLRLEREQMREEGLIFAQSHFPVSLTLIIAILLLLLGLFALGSIALDHPAVKARQNAQNNSASELFHQA